MHISQYNQFAGLPRDSTSHHMYAKSLWHVMSQYNPCLLLQSHQVKLHHIESRPSKQSSSDFEFFVSCDNKSGGLKESLEAVKGVAKNFRLISPSEDTGLLFTFVQCYLQSIFLFMNLISSLPKLKICIFYIEKYYQIWTFVNGV